MMCQDRSDNTSSKIQKLTKEKTKLPTHRGNQLYQKLSNKNILSRPTPSTTENKSPRASTGNNVKKSVTPKVEKEQKKTFSNSRTGAKTTRKKMIVKRSPKKQSSASKSSHKKDDNTAKGTLKNSGSTPKRSNKKTKSLSKKSPLKNQAKKLDEAKSEPHAKQTTPSNPELTTEPNIKDDTESESKPEDIPVPEIVIDPHQKKEIELKKFVDEANNDLKSDLSIVNTENSNTTSIAKTERHEAESLALSPKSQNEKLSEIVSQNDINLSNIDESDETKNSKQLVEMMNAKILAQETFAHTPCESLNSKLPGLIFRPSYFRKFRANYSG